MPAVAKTQRRQKGKEPSRQGHCQEPCLQVTVPVGRAIDQTSPGACSGGWKWSRTRTRSEGPHRSPVSLARGRRQRPLPSGSTPTAHSRRELFEFLIAEGIPQRPINMPEVWIPLWVCNPDALLKAVVPSPCPLLVSFHDFTFFCRTDLDIQVKVSSSKMRNSALSPGTGFLPTLGVRRRTITY